MLLLVSAWPQQNAMAAEFVNSRSEEVTVHVMDVDGSPARNAKVFVTRGDDGSFVFVGNTDENGKIAFQIDKPARIEEDVVDRVYAIRVLTADGELKVRHINVPYVREGRTIAKEAAEQVQDGIVQLQLTGEPNSVRAASTSDGFLLLNPGQCERWPDGSRVCLLSRTLQTRPAEVVRVHLVKNETATVTIERESTQTLESGYNSGGKWSVSGTLTFQIAGRRETIHPLTGTDMGNGASVHIVTRNYEVAIEHWSIEAPFGDARAEWYEVYAVRHLGPGSTGLGYDSRNGKPWLDVINQVYGAHITLDPGVSRRTTNTSTTTFSSGITVTTPVGTFSGKVTNSFKSTDTILLSNPTNKPIYHYDWDRTGNQWYATTR